MRRASYLSLVRRTLSTAMMAAAVLFMASCGDDPTTPEPTPTPTPSVKVDEVVKWMDGRLQKEYMWMDEYNEKHSNFDLSLAWDKFLDKTLLSLTTNKADGGEDDYGRYIYTYVTREQKTKADYTRATFPTTAGYGIELHPVVYIGIAKSLDGYTKDDGAFFIDHVYPGSAAEEAGLQRGDWILQVDGKKISQHNYSELIAAVRSKTGSAKLTAYYYDEQSEKGKIDDYSLTTSDFEQNPVAFCDVLTLDEKFGAGDKKVGYLSYLSFDGDFDDALVDAMTDLSQKGVTDMILDLRINGGGHVTSSVLLASMLLDESYVGPGKIYARLKHNPNNKVNEDEEYTLQNRYTPNGASASVDLPNIGINKLWVICSEYSASASEMVIVGLRGLGIDVELVGKRTEGKNCGMEVTYKTVDDYKYEFAPITFMNENGEGFSDYADGITPDFDFSIYEDDTSIDESLSDECYYYPMPRAEWGDAKRDFALCEVVKQICGSSLFESSAEAFAPKRVVTRSGGAEAKYKTLKFEREGLLSRGMIVELEE